MFSSSAPNDGNSGHELWAYNTSNSSNPWLNVMDINSGSDSSNPLGDNMAVVVGDTLYFDADDGSAGLELWAHDTSNQSTWQVTDISSGSGNGVLGDMQILVELWAHDTSNYSTWQVADINTGSASSGVGEWLLAVSLAIPSICLLTNQAQGRSYGRTIHSTKQHGRSWTFTPDPRTVCPDGAWISSLVIPSISTHRMESTIMSCGHMIPRMIPHGE